MAICLIYLLIHADGVSAYDISINVTENGILEDNLVMRFQANGVFTERVIKFLTRGFTVKIGYTIELWQSRKWWFDRLNSEQKLDYQIDFEPLEKRYTCRVFQLGKAVTSKLERQLSKIIQWTTQPEFPVVVAPVAQLDSEASYYYNIVVSIVTLTAEDINDLRKWIKVGEKGKETSTITKTSFRMAKDAISARHRRQVSLRSRKFRARDLTRIRA